MKRVRTVLLLLVFLLAATIPLFAQSPESSLTIHVVQRGETLFRIAQRYGVSMETLITINAIADPTNILVGQRLLVPVSLAESVVPRTHIVQAGETLRSIANLYGVTTEQLAAVNNIVNSDLVYIGQILTIDRSADPEVLPTEVPARSSPAIESGPSSVYVVQRGDTLYRIARQYGVTVNQLTQANSITDPTLIFAGQRLIIPGVELPALALDLPPTVTGLEIMPVVLVEGQSGRIRLRTSVPLVASGSFLDRALNFTSDNDGLDLISLVGVPMFTTPGVYPLNLQLTDGTGRISTLSANIQVAEGAYGAEYIRLTGNQSDLLDPQLEADELAQITAIMSNFTPQRYFDGLMGLPAAASISSPYGRKRSYNGGPINRFHQGTDFAGAPGSPILAPAPGYVVFAGPLTVRGNTTIIDHGWGVFTGYWHQTDIRVAVGDYVSAGQMIGTIGSTGRVTGPHLHWELWVNGVPVDPMQWVRQPFLTG